MADATFQIELGVAGAATVDSAASSLEALKAKLSGTKSAAEQASEAIKSAEASYNANEAAADRAAKALDKVNVALETASGKKLENLKKRQEEATAAFDKAKTELTQSAAALDKLKSATNGASEATKKADINAKKLGGALRDLGGPLGNAGNNAAQFVDTMQDLSETIGAAGPYVALAVAIVAITTAAISATAALAAWAIKGADAARTQNLLTSAMAGGVKEGERLNDVIDNLAAQVPQTNDELRKMAADLSKAGLKGKELEDALESAAFEAAEAKFGPEWEKQMTSLTKLGSKLQAALDRLFKTLNIEKVLNGLASLVGLFDKGEVSANALETVFGDVVQQLLNFVADVIPKVRSAFIQFEILVLKAIIAIKPFGSSILFVVEAVAAFAAVIVGALVVGLVIVTGLITGLIALGYMFFKVLMDVGGAIANWFKSLGDISLVDMGNSLMMGLVNGMLAAGPAVLSALGGIVTSAIDSAKHLLGIASPSKVFAEIGQNTGEGMAQGVEGATPSVSSALETMVSPPDASGGESSGHGGASANLSGATFNFYGVEGAEDAEARFGALLTRLLEGDASQLGLGVAGA